MKTPAWLTKLSGRSILQRNFVYILLRQLLSAIAQFLTIIAIARELGPQGNGLYAMTILLPSMLATFLNLGVGPATVYYLSRKETSPQQALRENTHIASIISIFGLTIALLTIATWSPTLFPGIPTTLLLVGATAFPMTLLSGYLNTIFQGLENFRSFTWAGLAPPYITFIGVAASLYIFDMGVYAVVSSYIIGQLSGLLLVRTLLSRHLKSCTTKQSDESYLKGYKTLVLSYGYRAHLSNILAFINYRADIFLVNFFLTPFATGIYVIAVQFAEKLWMLSQAASTVLLPRLSSMHEDPQARSTLTNKAFLLVSGLTATGAIVLSAILYYLIKPVFGGDYSSVYQPFLLLVPGIIAGAGARIQSNCIAAAGKPEWNMYVSFFVLSLNIAGNILLIPTYGVAGAATATSIAYISNAFLKALIIKRV